MRKAAAYRLKASTLVETLVALVITMIVFSMALSAILQSQRSDRVRDRLKASALLDKYGDQDYSFPLSPDSVKAGDMTVVIQTVANDTVPGLYLLEMTAYSDQKVLLAKKRLVKKKGTMSINPVQK